MSNATREIAKGLDILTYVSGSIDEDLKKCSQEIPLACIDIGGEKIEAIFIGGKIVYEPSPREVNFLVVVNDKGTKKRINRQTIEEKLRQRRPFLPPYFSINAKTEQELLSLSDEELYEFLYAVPIFKRKSGAGIIERIRKHFTDKYGAEHEYRFLTFGLKRIYGYEFQKPRQIHDNIGEDIKNRILQLGGRKVRAIYLFGSTLWALDPGDLDFWVAIDKDRKVKEALVNYHLEMKERGTASIVPTTPEDLVKMREDMRFSFCVAKVLYERSRGAGMRIVKDVRNALKKKYGHAYERELLSYFSEFVYRRHRKYGS